MNKAITDILTEIAFRHLPLATRKALDPDANLEALGLDSLAFAGFLVDIERTFDVVFPADAIHRDTFRTLRVTAASMEALRTTHIVGD